MCQNDIFYKRPDENALRWVKWGGVGGQIYYKLYICDNIKSFRVNWLGKTKNLMRLFKTKKGHGI